MAEKISLAHRLFEQNRRFFVHHHPGATSTFRCPRCEYPVLIDRDATGFHAQCACIESGCEDLSEVPETPRQWLELMGQPAKEIVVCFPQDLTATIELITYPESLESHQLRLIAIVSECWNVLSGDETTEEYQEIKVGHDCPKCAGPIVRFATETPFPHDIAHCRCLVAMWLTESSWQTAIDEMPILASLWALLVIKSEQKSLMPPDNPLIAVKAEGLEVVAEGVKVGPSTFRSWLHGVRREYVNRRRSL
jgi:hypothetical protein